MDTSIPFEIWIDTIPEKANTYSTRVADSSAGIVSGGFSLDLEDSAFKLERVTVEGQGVDM